MTEWVLLSGMVTEQIDERATSFSVQPHSAAIVAAVLDAYERRAIRQTIELELERLMEKKVTLVHAGENVLGATMIIAREGRLFYGRRGIALLPKGARTKGVGVRSQCVLEVVEGWDMVEARDRVMAVRAQFPQIKPLTRERLLQLPKHGRGGDCSLALFGSHPLFGSHDAVWLAGEYWPVEDIVEQSVLLIRPEHAVSERGSVFGRELLSMPLGEIVGFSPMSWRHALELTDMEYEQAYDYVMAQVSATLAEGGVPA